MGSDPEKLFPFSMMQEHLKRYGKFGIIMAKLILPMITRDGACLDLDTISDGLTDDGLDFDEDAFFTETSISRLKERFNEVLVDIGPLGLHMIHQNSS